MHSAIQTMFDWSFISKVLHIFFAGTSTFHFCLFSALKLLVLVLTHYLYIMKGMFSFSKLSISLTWHIFFVFRITASVNNKNMPWIKQGKNTEKIYKAMSHIIYKSPNFVILFFLMVTTWRSMDLFIFLCIEKMPTTIFFPVVLIDAKINSYPRFLKTWI